MSALKYLFSLEELYPPFRVDTTVLFGKELHSHFGHKIRWVFLAESDVTESGELVWDGGKAYVVKSISGSNLSNKVLKQLKKFVVDFRFFWEAMQGDWDFIQTRDRFFGGVLGVIASKLKGVKFFFWLSFPFPEMYETRVAEGNSSHPAVDKIKAKLTGFFLYKIIAKHADHLFVQSDQMMRDLIEKGVPAEKMTPVPMAISANEVLCFVEKHRREPVKNRIVYLGTLGRDRKLDFMVRVTKIVADRLGEIEMVFVGDGDDESDRDIITDEAERLKIGGMIKITGVLPRSEAWKYVRNAGVSVSPFYPTPILNSTSPTKLVEYMALGSPVVANDHPEQRKLINESRGGICVDWNEKEFADAIVKIMTNEALSSDMSERGHEYVLKNRDYKMIAKTLNEKYQELCNI